MLASPAELIATFLIQVGQAASPSTPNPVWPVFIGHEPASPDNCITVYNIGHLYEGKGQHTGRRKTKPHVQVRVRGTNEQVGYQKGIAIQEEFDFLRGNNPMGFTLHSESLTLIGTNIYLPLLPIKREEEDKRRAFVMSVRISIREEV